MLDRCRVMGVINVTPDSFSDGGAFDDADSAVKHGLQLLAAGADMLDVGGESTRPGAQRVSPEEEQLRVLPVIRALADAGAVVSIDTMRASTAEAALHAGARHHQRRRPAASRTPTCRAWSRAAGVPYVVMHWRGHSAGMQQQAVYDDVVREVRDELAARVDAVVAAGVDTEQVIVDPGIGFAKNAEHNWALLAHLRDVDVARPAGARRRQPQVASSARCSPTDGEPRPVVERDDATAAITALAAAAGAWAVRVHEARASADAVRVAAAVLGARTDGDA